MSTIERLSPDGFSEPEPGVRYLTMNDAGPTIEALRSETAQSILSAMGDGPTTATGIADRVETSLQNVCYHLSRLEEAGLVSVVGTRYSEKGAEMNVYAREIGALVIGEPSSLADGD